MRKFHNFRDAHNNNVISALYGKFEDSDKNVNIQFLGLSDEKMEDIKRFVFTNSYGKMFIQGFDANSSTTWAMIEFWTDDMKFIKERCVELIEFLGVKKEDVQGWEHPDFNNVFGDVK
ncbi:hypothetical protein F485_gp282 [Aeromonas phage CC2]|uniref:Uncharacterized protein n=1 Tax=Aeromonas phage CC2 TaxID=1204516 RepID=I6XLB0_9CAUD|nr:hypothetical protein F485_gp282 [Aeromonas phage CC2]AFN39314.1 hypothetical protein CC2_013 [Aeromonas phage CC2]